jgi:hypothetical protein
MKEKIMPRAPKPTRAEWKASEKARRRQQAEAEMRDKEPRRPHLPDLSMLTIPDRQRCTRALGVDMPLPEGAYGPQPDAFLSKQLADRFVADLGRHNDREARKRGEAIRPGSFQAKTASPEDVRRRVGDLGLDPHVMPPLVAVDAIDSKTGKTVKLRPLDPPAHVNAATQTHSQAEKDMEAARVVHRAMQLGQRFDARKLTPGQIRALLQLRGAG